VEHLSAPLSLSFQIATNLLCFYICLFYAIVGLHVDEKVFNDFLTRQ
jgi:hypothetical protein